jgi:uncharacterized membrane protein
LEKEMADPIEKLDRKLRSMLADAYNIKATDAETILEVALKCAKTSGVVSAATLGAAAGVYGGLVSVGTLVLPAWVAGALAGFVGGTLVCSMHDYTASKSIESFLKLTGHTNREFETEIESILNRTRSISSPVSRRERFSLNAG